MIWHVTWVWIQRANTWGQDWKRNILAPGTTFYWCRNPEEEVRKFFIEEGELFYCCDIPGLIHLLWGAYEPDNWHLFIDSFKRCLKAVLRNNEQKLASVPVAHSSSHKESYENLQIVLEKAKYNEDNWYVCCDLKIRTILLGLHGSYTKFLRFLCEWDSRAR